MSFRLSFPFKPGNEFQGSCCPFAGLPIGRDRLRLCNVWSITHQGAILACDGVHPPDLCDLSHNNDVVVTLRRPVIAVPQ